MSFIYKITNLINGKTYVGQTNNCVLRWSQHRSDAKHEPKLLIDKVIKKYGIDNFAYQVIEECRSQAETDYQEIWHIFICRSLVCEEGYNVALGGMKLLHTPEIRHKISLGRKKYFETHESKRKGMKLSEDHKRNLSKAATGKPGTNLGKKFSSPHRLKISKSQPKECLKLRKFSPDIEQDICRLYLKEKLSMYALSKKFQCQRTTIGDILFRNKIDKRIVYLKQNNNRRMFTADQEREMCNLYLSGSVTVPQLSNIFNGSQTTIRNILIRNKAKG